MPQTPPLQKDEASGQKDVASEQKNETTRNSLQTITLSMTELEIKFAYQQETIESLNEEVTKQWKVIDQLTQKLGLLHDQMSNMVYDGENTPNDPPPPHY